MRARALIAIAHRDLAAELAGRRGLLLPLIAAAILLPSATAPPFEQTIVQSSEVRVAGAVPDAVRALEDVIVDDTRGKLRFIAPTVDERAWILEGDHVARSIRTAMDAADGTFATRIVEPPFGLPERSLLLSLIGASVLTGAIAQSIPGERASGTLATLLTAAVSRLEVVVGKWLAWSAFGGGLACLAVAITLALGHQEPGWWLIPVPVVSMGTVAVGLFLVRRANDVIGGATVGLRVLPALLTGSGLMAWVVGRFDPLAGAALPIGGALMAAGNTWPGPAPALLATASTLALSGGLLWLTSRDLEHGEAPAVRRGSMGVVLSASVAAMAWWAGVVGPLMWALGGNPSLSATLPPADGVLAGTVGLGLMVSVHMGRVSHPLMEHGARWIRSGWSEAVWVGLALALSAPVAGLLPLPAGELALDARQRFGAALNPAWAGPALFGITILVQEMLFRGRYLRNAPLWLAVGAWTLVVSPTDPILGLTTGTLLHLLARRAGSIAPGVLARVLWAVAPASLAVLAPWAALGVAVVASLALVALDRARPSVGNVGAAP